MLPFFELFFAAFVVLGQWVVDGGAASPALTCHERSAVIPEAARCVIISVPEVCWTPGDGEWSARVPISPAVLNVGRHALSSVTL